MALNNLLFVGRATDDAKDCSSNGKKIAEFTLAINRRFDREKSDFHKVRVFDKTAEMALQYVKKGTSLSISGNIRNDNYTNRDGEKVYGFSIVANNISFENGQSVNMATFCGNVVADPEIRYTQGENSRAVIRYRLAVSRGKDAADFFSVVTFSKSADFFEKNVHKGTPLFVTGEWQNSNWEDKDGKKHYDNVLITERVELGFRNNSNSGGDSATSSGSDFMSIPDGIIEELPFT